MRERPIDVTIFDEVDSLDRNDLEDIVWFIELVRKEVANEQD